MRRLLLVLALSTAAAMPSAVAQDADSRFLYRHTSTIFESEVPPEAAAPVWETSAVLPGGTEGEAWSAVLYASHVTGDVTYSVTGSAPGWLSLDPVTGLLAGIPADAGGHQFDVRAAIPSGGHADRTFTVQVEQGPDETPPVWQDVRLPSRRLARRGVVRRRHRDGRQG